MIDTARLNIDYARITSPTEGVTGVRLVDQGNLVRASDQTGLVVVTQLDPIAVLFTLPQDDLTEVATQHAKGALKVEFTSRDGSEALGVGDLVLIDNRVNAQTSTIRLKATVPNDKHVLWPNAFVKARLRVDTRHNALVVPTVAVQRGPQGTYVYVIDANKTAQMKPVTVEQSEDDVTIVVQGIEPGDIVITDGQSQLRPGAKVSTRESARENGADDGGAPGSRPRGSNRNGPPRTAPTGRATAGAGEIP